MHVIAKMPVFASSGEIILHYDNARINMAKLIPNKEI